MELVEQNAESERQCAVLREQLAREAEALLRSRRGKWFRLRGAAIGAFERLFGRSPGDKAMTPFNTFRHPKQVAPNWACALGDPQAASD